MSRVKRREAVERQRPRLRALVGALCAAWLSLAGPLHAQDLAGSAPAGERDLFALLEHALPARERGLAAAAATTRWWGLRELETRAVALGGSAGALRIATGLSQTGAPELGWTTLALAAALRASGAAAWSHGTIATSREYHPRARAAFGAGGAGA
jgi:hypothetical protein